MELTGSLPENGLRKFLVDLATAGMSGTLELRQDQHRVSLYFREGKLCSLRTPGIDLVKFVQKYREDHPTTSIRVVLDFAECQVVDALAEIIQWDSADYCFEVESPRRVESVLRTPKDGAQLYDRAKELYNAYQLTRQNLPAPYMFLNIKRIKNVRASLSKDELLLLSHIKQGVPVRDLRANYPKGKYYFNSELVPILRSGIVKVVDPSTLRMTTEAEKKSTESSGSITTDSGRFKPDLDEIDSNLSFLDGPDPDSDKRVEKALSQSSGAIRLTGLGEATPSKKKKKAKKRVRPDGTESSGKLGQLPDPSDSDVKSFSYEDFDFDSLFTAEGLERDRSGESTAGSGTPAPKQKKKPKPPRKAEAPPPDAAASQEEEDDVGIYFMEDLTKSDEEISQDSVSLQGQHMVDFSTSGENSDSIQMPGFFQTPPNQESQNQVIPYSGRRHPLKPRKALHQLTPSDRQQQVEAFLEYLPKIGDPLELIHPDVAPHLDHYLRACLEEKRDFSLMLLVQKSFEMLLKAPKYLHEEVLMCVDKVVKGIVKAHKTEHLANSVKYLLKAFPKELPTKTFERLCQYSVVINRSLIKASRNPEAEQLSGYFEEEFDKNPSQDFVRQRLSLRVLCELNTMTSIGALRKALDNWEWRDLAIDAMRKAGPASLPTILALTGKMEKADLREQLFDLIKLQGKAAVPTIIRRLNAKDFLVRIAAIKALTRLHYSETFGYIQRMVKDPQPEVRVEALRAIPHLGLQSLDAFLVRMLEDPDERVRMQVLKLMPDHASQRSVQALRLSIVSKFFVRGDGDDDLLVAACQTLGHFRLPQTVPDFIRLLRNRDLHRNTRRGLVVMEVCRQLVRLNAKDALPYIEEMEKRPDSPDTVKTILGHAKASLEGKEDGSFFAVAREEPASESQNYGSSSSSASAAGDDFIVDI